MSDNKHPYFRTALLSYACNTLDRVAGDNNSKSEEKAGCAVGKIILQTFNIELAYKSLLEMTGSIDFSDKEKSSCAYTHDLYKLHCLLDTEVSKSIEQNFTKNFLLKKGNVTIEKFLKDNSSKFIEWRYFGNGKNINADFEGLNKLYSAIISECEKYKKQA